MRFIALLTTAAVIPSGVKQSRGIYAFTAFYADGSCEDPSTRYRSLRMTALLRIFIRAINENLKAVSIQKEDALRPLSLLSFFTLGSGFYRCFLGGLFHRAFALGRHFGRRGGGLAGSGRNGPDEAFGARAD